MNFIKKQNSHQNSVGGEYSRKLHQIKDEGEYGSYFGKTYFLIEPMSLDAAFDTDSEYHMYFTQKLILVAFREEIAAHFWTFLP